MNQLECGTRGWSLRPSGFDEAEALPIVNGTLDGRAAVSFLADLEVAAALLRGFIEDVGGAE
ncbi:hypothetical protein [Salipiger bermudensis]|uniref:hypothetical protein n=1 Tax=Salipiger bermudensis TaxID=344736 RepID=UPI001CD8139F|nr:hypothetical protein [Salipiger bermudensis]MCA0963299.1 hypothetical protein [Salipiger bermudensis]